MKEIFGDQSQENVQNLYEYLFKNEPFDKDLVHSKNLRKMARSYVPFVRLCDLELSLGSLKFLLDQKCDPKSVELLRVVSEGDFVGFINFLKNRQLFDVTVSVLVDLIWSVLIYSNIKSLSLSDNLSEIVIIFTLTKIVQSKAKINKDFINFKLHLERKVFDTDVKLVCELYEKLKVRSINLSFLQTNFYSNLHCSIFAENLINLLDYELQKSITFRRHFISNELRCVIQIIFNQRNIVNEILDSNVPLEIKEIVDTHEKLLVSINSLMPSFEINNSDFKRLYPHMQNINNLFNQLNRFETKDQMIEASKDSFLTIPLTLLFLEVLPQAFSLLVLEDKSGPKSNFAYTRVKMHDLFVSLTWKIFTDATETKINPETKSKLTKIITNKELVGIMGIFVQQISSKTIQTFDDLLYLLEKNVLNDFFENKPFISKIAKVLDKENFHHFYAMQVIQILKGKEKTSKFFNLNGNTQLLMKLIRIGFSGKSQQRIRNLAELLNIIESSDQIDFDLFNLTESEREIISNGYSFEKKSQKFKFELSRLKKVESKQHSTNSFEQKQNGEDFLIKQEITTVYDIYMALIKLNLRIHPRYILYFIIQSSSNDSSKLNYSLNMSEVINFLKSSIYSLTKEDLKIFKMTPIIFSALNFILISTVQKIFSRQTEFFFSNELSFFLLMAIISIIGFWVIRIILFKWRRVQLSDVIKSRLKQIIIH